MQEIYFRLLQDIERADYNVYAHRFRVSNFTKILITSRVWWNNRKR